MAAAASKIIINRPPAKRGEIKLKIFKAIAKSLQNLAIGVPGERKKAAGNTVGSSGCCSSTATVTPVELVGKLKPASKHGIKQNQPRRGQIKIKIVKIVAKSIQNLAARAAGGKKKAAGNEGRSGCSSSPAIVAPLETLGGLKPDSGREIKQNRRERGEIKIKICDTIDGSVIQFSEFGGKDETAIGRWFRPTAGIVPMKTVNGCESEELCDYI